MGYLKIVSELENSPEFIKENIRQNQRNEGKHSHSYIRTLSSILSVYIGKHIDEYLVKNNLEHRRPIIDYGLDNSGKQRLAKLRWHDTSITPLSREVLKGNKCYFSGTLNHKSVISINLERIWKNGLFDIVDNELLVLYVIARKAILFPFASDGSYKTWSQHLKTSENNHTIEKWLQYIEDRKYGYDYFDDNDNEVYLSKWLKPPQTLEELQSRINDNLSKARQSKAEKQKVQDNEIKEYLKNISGLNNVQSLHLMGYTKSNIRQSLSISRTLFDRLFLELEIELIEELEEQQLYDIEQRLQLHHNPFNLKVS